MCIKLDMQNAEEKLTMTCFRIGRWEHKVIKVLLEAYPAKI